MSLLWIEAAVMSGGSKNTGRLIEKIMVGHRDADPEAARRALATIRRYARAGEHIPPKKVGFAGVPRFSVAELPHEARSSEAWQGVPVTHIDPSTARLYATQHYLRPDLIAHNLFHPGAHPPKDPDAIGDPDVEPEPRVPHDDGEKQAADDTRATRLVTHHMGFHVVTDGHHRLAADLMLGKSQIPVRVQDLRYKPEFLANGDSGFV